MGTTGQRMRHIGLQAACGAMMLVSTAYATKESDREHVDRGVYPVMTRVDGLGQVSGSVKQPDPRVTQVLAQTAAVHTVAEMGLPEADASNERLEKAIAEPQKKSPVESLHIQFASGKHELRQKQKKKLDTVAEKLAANPTYTADIDGEVHRQGAKSYSDTLSWKRREAVRHYLVEKRSDLLPRVSLIGERQDFAEPAQTRTGRRDVTITIYKPVPK